MITAQPKMVGTAAKVTPDNREDTAFRQVAGGYTIGTLNHIAGPTATKEWVDSVLEEQRLIARLQKVAADRSRHELTLLMNGYTREQLYEALREATE